jgi:hypothetical protein
MSLTQETEAISRLTALLQSIVDIVPTWADGMLGFETANELMADSDLTSGLDVGRKVRVLEHDGFDLEVVASAPADYTTAAGTLFRVRMDLTSPMYFGATGDGVTDDTAALDAADASDALTIDLRGRSYRYVGSFAATKPIVNGTIEDDDGAVSFAPVQERRIATTQEAAAALTPETGEKLARLADVAAMVSAALSASLPSIQGRMIVIDPNSGSYTANQWLTRPFTQTEINTIAGAQLVNNKLVLPTGRYQLRAIMQAEESQLGMRTRIRDVLNNVTLATSLDYASDFRCSVHPEIQIEMIFGAPVELELQYLASRNGGPTGLGRYANYTNLSGDYRRYALFEVNQIG